MNDRIFNPFGFLNMGKYSYKSISGFRDRHFANLVRIIWGHNEI